MKLAFSTSVRMAALSTALLLSACGGGGGDSDGPSTPPATSASSVTSSNMQEVSAEGVSTSNALNSQINGGAGMVMGVSIDTASAGLVDVTLQQLYRGLGAQDSAGFVAGVAMSETVACVGGGTLLITADIASEEHPSAGDTLAMSASNCKEGDVTLNGKVAFKFNSITGMPGETTAWSGELATTFTNFTVTTGGQTQSTNGDMLIKANQASFDSTTYAVSGNSLVVGTSEGGATVTRTITNYTYAGSDQSGTQTYNANFTFSGTLPDLGKVTYTVTTLADFKLQGDTYPYEGSMKIMATDKTSVTLTAVDSTTVTLGLDSDGNGTIDSTTTTTWAALDALS